MSSDAISRTGSRDGVRQVVVVASAVLGIAGAAIGSGAFGGTPIASAAGGALSADSTLVAPAGPAFGVWSVIYTGLVGLSAWQALPAHREDPRQRATGWWTAASLLLNAVWIGTVQAGGLWLSVVVIAVLLVVLVRTFTLLLRERPTSRVEAVLVDGTVGLYLGWVSIATVANTAAALRASGLTGGETGWAVGVLGVATAVGAFTAVRSRGRLAFGAGLAWGLGWVAAGRAGAEQNTSTTVAVAAGVAATVVAGTTVAARLSNLLLSRARRRRLG
ncbi:tryptophan-rich sensory protein [Kineococcus rhizosphaerae]|uniref:TspO/MBR related protein n=1 Tax=Kineococcus rhizosphaerae TaxID=559628 RepID=A0A2T0RBM2_9ACTN|nr:tryptophan-rich sensory protein [Kineococcus rhizosphaerae]PRY18562.1 TspO/MBR related protein [Kineococcus rhizosphaerae]